MDALNWSVFFFFQVQFLAFQQSSFKTSLWYGLPLALCCFASENLTVNIQMQVLLKPLKHIPIPFGMNYTVISLPSLPDLSLVISLKLCLNGSLASPTIPWQAQKKKNIPQMQDSTTLSPDHWTLKTKQKTILKKKKKKTVKLLCKFFNGHICWDWEHLYWLKEGSLLTCLQNFFFLLPFKYQDCT